MCKGQSCEGSTVRYTHFLVNIVKVNFHGTVRKVEAPTYFLVGQTFCHEEHDLALAWCKRSQ